MFNSNTITIGFNERLFPMNFKKINLSLVYSTKFLQLTCACATRYLRIYKHLNEDVEPNRWPT